MSVSQSGDWLGHSAYMNYMDDDTVEVGCHYCKWESTGHEDEDDAQRAIDEHTSSGPSEF